MQSIIILYTKPLFFIYKHEHGYLLHAAEVSCSNLTLLCTCYLLHAAEVSCSSLTLLCTCYPLHAADVSCSSLTLLCTSSTPKSRSLHDPMTNCPTTANTAEVCWLKLVIAQSELETIPSLIRAYIAGRTINILHTKPTHQRQGPHVRPRRFDIFYISHVYARP